MKKTIYALLTIILVFVNAMPAFALEEKQDKQQKNKIPSHVLNISKENTYPNASQDQVMLEPSELAEELINESEVEIDNPDLIKMLNETSLRPSPIAIGYRGMIFLGHWPLNYQSKETGVNWEYQKINLNQLNNLGGTKVEKMNYIQEKEVHVKGGLTAKVKHADEIQKMMLLKARENTELPLSFRTVIGKGTKKEQTYNIPQKKIGYLYAYAPAVNEKGVVTYGEVYLKLKGSKKYLVVRNVTKQGVGAWIPVQDHVSFSFRLK